MLFHFKSAKENLGGFLALLKMNEINWIHEVTSSFQSNPSTSECRMKGTWREKKRGLPGVLCAEAILGCIAASGQLWAASKSYSNAWGDSWQLCQPLDQSRGPEMQRHHEAVFLPCLVLSLLGGTGQNLALTFFLISTSQSFHTQHLQRHPPYMHLQNWSNVFRRLLFSYSQNGNKLDIRQLFGITAGTRSNW